MSLAVLDQRYIDNADFSRFDEEFVSKQKKTLQTKVQHTGPGSATFPLTWVPIPGSHEKITT